MPDYYVITWYALAFPARTPEPMVARLNETMAAALRLDAVRRQMLNAAFVPAEVGTPRTLAAHLEREIAKWGEVMRNAGIEQQQDSGGTEWTTRCCSGCGSASSSRTGRCGATPATGRASARSGTTTGG